MCHSCQECRQCILRSAKLSLELGLTSKEMTMSRVSSVLIPLLTMMACSTGTEVKIGTTNSPPSVTIMSPGDGEMFDEYMVVHFQAKVSDSYDSPEDLTIYWGSDLQGDLESQALPDSQGNLLFSTANLEPGVHVVTLTALDTDGGQGQASVSVEVIDQPEDPTIEILQPTGADSTIENTAFTLMVEVWDARDDIESLPVFMSSDIDGEICQTNPAANGMAECDALLSAGTHLLEFTVNNSSGFDASATTYFEVISTLDVDDDGDGFTENQNDCDDNDPTVNPGAPEVENSTDDNCNGVIDEGTNAFDDDGDGFTENQGDCNDNTIAINPSAIEICGNGVDDNCNGNQNEIDAVDCVNYYRDGDGDNYGDPLLSECWCQPGGTTGEFDVTNNTDCYDGNANAHPGQQSYFSLHRGDGSFNYDCSVDSSGNPTIQQEFTIMGACNSWSSSIGDCTMNTAGWGASIPQCGVSGNYIHDNDSCSVHWECLNPFVSCSVCQADGPSYTSEIQRCK